MITLTVNAGGLDLLRSLKIPDGLMTQRPLLRPMQRWSHDGVGAMFYRAISAPASITCAIRAAGLGTGVRRWRSSGLGGRSQSRPSDKCPDEPSSLIQRARCRAVSSAPAAVRRRLDHGCAYKFAYLRPSVGQTSRSWGPAVGRPHAALRWTTRPTHPSAGAFLFIRSAARSLASTGHVRMTRRGRPAGNREPVFDSRLAGHNQRSPARPVRGTSPGRIASGHRREPSAVGGHKSSKREVSCPLV